MIAATRINASQFTISGDYTGDTGLRIGMRLKCYMGTDGNLTTDTSVVSYSAGTGLTTVTVTSTALTANLTEIRRGPVFNDRVALETNLCVHGHEDDDDGGTMPAAGFPDAGTVTRLVALAGTSPYIAGFVLGMNAAGDGFSKYELVGDDLTITIGETTITIALPQPIDTTDSPEFAGLTVSGLTGLMLSNGASACTALAASAGNQVPRRNVANSGYEFIGFLLEHLGDSNMGETLVSGQALVLGEDLKWTNGIPAQAGSVIQASPATIGTMYTIASLMI